MTIDVTDVPELEPIEQHAVQTVSEPAGEDFAANTSTAGQIAVGGSATGKIERGEDRDWFAVELEAGRTYLIDLEGSPTGAGTLWDPYLRGIHDADGDLIPGTTDNHYGAGRNSRLTFRAQDTGDYYVAAGAFGIEEGTYTLSVEDVTGDVTGGVRGGRDDFLAWTGTSGAVEVDGSATGEIDSIGDRDWFEVELDADKTYQIDLKGSYTGDGTLFNPYLRGIYDANGNFIARTTDDDDGAYTNSRVFFRSEEAGVYYVAAGAHKAGEGTYTLSVAEVMDDFEAGTSGVVEVGGSVMGKIDSIGDRDWFAVELEEGKNYQIDLKGLRTGDGTLADPDLRGIHDTNGNFIPGTIDDNSGASVNSRVYFTAEETATYYVAAGAFLRYVGTYTLSVVEVPEDIAAGTGTIGAVAVGGSARGHLETGGDHDWFAVTLDAGSTYRIDLEASPTRAGTLHNPYLRGVHDADGVLLADTTDDNGGTDWNSRVYFSAEEDATYYVAAGGWQDQRGSYTLSVDEVM